MNKVVVLLASLGAFAAAAQPANEEVAPPAPTAEMQGRMADMQALMERMRTTKDPAERQRLMAEHMRLMHDGMAMMGPMMHGSANEQQGERACADNDMQCRMQRMQNQQGMMGQRMSMMQMMMQQMMEHMTQQDAAATPDSGAGHAH